MGSKKTIASAAVKVMDAKTIKEKQINGEDCVTVFPDTYHKCIIVDTVDGIGNIARKRESCKIVFKNENKMITFQSFDQLWSKLQEII